MSFVNFIRLISPDGGTWEQYSRRKWGVGVTRYHGWFDGKVTKAWTKILSRPDASLRWKSLKNKGWRETVRRNPGADPLRGDCGTYALAYAELHKAQNPTIVFFLGDNIPLSANDKEALQELDVSELDFVHVAVKIDGKMYDAEGVFTNEKAGKEYKAAIASEFSYKKNKSQLGTVIRNNTNFTQDWQYWYAKLTRGGARRNPTDKRTRIGEWWIDDSGTALYADGDVGDMGHEAYVIDMLTRRLLNAMDVDTDSEHVGNLMDKENKKLILASMKEEGFDGTIEEFVEEAAKTIWKDPKQREAAIDIADGRGDARKYGMQYDGWIRVAGHGFECWELTKEVLKHMGDGLYDAIGGGEEIDGEEIFEIYVHKTGMHYTDVPWRVINEGDPGALRVYGTKNNPPKEFSLSPIEGAKQLATKYGVQAMGWARTFASTCKARIEKEYWMAVYRILILKGNPAPHVPVMSYAAAHRWEAMAKAQGVSAVARSPRGFMRAYERAGTWARLDPWWKNRRNAFVARHMAQVRQNNEKLWKQDKSGNLRPSRRCLALLCWAFMPPGRR